jgi:hypothetical protein
MSTDFDLLLNDLIAYLGELEAKFLMRHIANQLANPTEYEYDVKAYCVLAHAAFEEFVETVSLKIMNKSIENWYYNKIINPPMLSLLSYSNTRLKIDEKEFEKGNNPKRIFDRLRNCIEETKEQYSREIKDNHGVSIKYLYHMLAPISIDVIEDPLILNSLDQLANVRGSYAHKKVVKSIIAPENARDYAFDCLRLCEHIRDQANKVV